MVGVDPCDLSEQHLEETPPVATSTECPALKFTDKGAESCPAAEMFLLAKQLQCRNSELLNNFTLDTDKSKTFPQDIEHGASTERKITLDLRFRVDEFPMGLEKVKHVVLVWCL